MALWVIKLHAVEFYFQFDDDTVHSFSFYIVSFTPVFYFYFIVFLVAFLICH